MENTEAGTEWGPPFSRAEYRQRTARTGEAMREWGIDLLFVSSPPNLTWLTGYDSIWYRRTTPTGLVIRACGQETLFFDSASHSDLVKSGTGCFDEVEFFDRRRAGPALETILESLKARGWLRGHLALERWSLAPGGMVLADLARGFEQAGCRVSDGSWLVDRIKMVKSPAEIAMMREAARIADVAMQAVIDEMAPGMMEVEIQGLAQYVMSRNGGEEPAIRTAVRSGPAEPPITCRRQDAGSRWAISSGWTSRLPTTVIMPISPESSRSASRIADGRISTRKRPGAWKWSCR